MSIRQNGLTLLVPFFKHVFLSPTVSERSGQWKSRLLTTLLHVCGQLAEEDAIHLYLFLRDIVPCLLIYPLSQQEETLEYLTTLAWHIDTNAPPTVVQSVLPVVTSHLVTLCGHLITSGLDVSACLRLLIRVVQRHPEVFHNTGVVLALFSLIGSTPQLYIAEVLKLGVHVLTSGYNLPPLVSGMLVIPLVQVLATWTSLSIRKSTEVLHLTGQLLEWLEKCNEKGKTNFETVSLPSLGLTPDYYINQMFLSQAAHLYNNPSLDLWIENTSSFNMGRKVAKSTTWLVGAILMSPQIETGIKVKALATLVTIAKKDHTQAPDMLPVFLYCLGKEKSPVVTMSVLNAIPNVTTHKLCVPAVLKTLQVLSNTPQLKPTSICLMTNLWQIQPRCFPYLQALLTDDDQGTMSRETGQNELIISKAAAIKDVCRERPDHHGADLLPVLSQLLTSCSTEGDAVPAGLALEGLYALCEAEVTDIRTVWNVLSSKLANDKRPLVLCKLCDLFSLVPQLEVDTPEYQVFSKSVVSLLWSLTGHSDFKVAKAAYDALSAFPNEAFTIEVLPQEITEGLKSEQADGDSAASRGQEQQEEMVSIPGECFVKLLKGMKPENVYAYQSFLSVLIEKEVEGIPRRTFYMADKMQRPSGSSAKALLGIPAFLLQQYETNKQPGLRAGLATSLLSAFDPQVDVGRDGKPKRHDLITHGRTYQMMLTGLLQEVPVQHTDWHRAVMLPKAWLGFMNRVYMACLEGRQAELELQWQHGHADESAEDKETKMAAVWLWVRDSLTDILKKTSRGSPTAQGNALLALSALAVTVTKYASHLDDSVLKLCDKESQHIQQSHWLHNVTSTVMTVVDTKYKAKGRVFWGKQISTGDSTSTSTSSFLARSCGCLALSMLVPVIVTKSLDLVTQVIQTLMVGLPGGAGAEESAMFQFHCGLGLGMTLARLVEERFDDMAGTEGMIVVWRALDELERSCLDPAVQNWTGSLLGIGQAISALCSDGKAESRAKVSYTFDVLKDALVEMEASTEKYQALAVSLAYISAAGYSSAILDVPRVTEVMERLSKLAMETPQSIGLSLASALLAYSLQQLDFPGVEKFSEDLKITWTNVLDKTEAPVSKQIAAISALLTLCGSESSTVNLGSSQTGSSKRTLDLNMNHVIKIATTLYSSSTDFSLQSHIACQLGALYLSSTGSTDTATSVPSNYSYFPETSILRPLVDLLLEAGKFATIAPEAVIVSLQSLLEGSKRVLPPINWPGILSPLMRLPDDTVKSLCLKVAASQCGTSSNAALFLTAWSTSPLYDTLPVPVRATLYQCLPELSKGASVTKLQQVLDKVFKEPFHTDSAGTEGCVMVLQGLRKALSMDHPPAVNLLLYQLLEYVYGCVDNNEIAIWCHVCECLQNVPDALFDKITSHDLEVSSAAGFLKGVFVRCVMVAWGHQPLTLINSCVDAVLTAVESCVPAALSMLAWCLWHCVDSVGAPQRLHWLLEYMGHMKTLIIKWSQQTGEEDRDQFNEAVRRCFCTFSAAVSLWSPCAAETALLIGLSPAKVKVSAVCTVDLGLMGSQLLTHLPAALPRLLELPPWDQITDPVIDWLLATHRTCKHHLHQHYKTCIQASLYSLRHTPQYKKATVWTQVVSVEP
ncbi:focadhesin isoform X2 [Lingula anatina]|uniref:Focadhesin isoform X2 n=1 Tax=Lingula anatina TaxID=7574 RepID=A0A1S3K967_LINAN|nr:focadhesin isoform X2 [Lingula anatina]|eukprot:XP_013419042.1 focadhesin isoform X2 [Lingula anatina]